MKRYDLGCWTIDGEIVPMAEGDYVLYADHLADRSSLLATIRQAVEDLEEYGSHELPCPLAQWSQGRPTKDGGYETMYAGKWYQRNEKPACTCGFDAALAACRGKLEGEKK